MKVSALNLNQVDEIVFGEDSVTFYFPCGNIEFDVSKHFSIKFYYKGEFILFYTRISLEIFAEEQRIVCV